MKNIIKMFCAGLCLVNFAYAVTITPSIQPASCLKNCIATIDPATPQQAAPGTTVNFKIQVNQSGYPNLTFSQPIIAQDNLSQTKNPIYCENSIVKDNGTGYTLTVIAPNHNCVLNVTVMGTYQLPSPPGSLVYNADSNGNLWFTEPFANQIGVFSPSTENITQYPVAGTGGPANLINGPNNSSTLWFNEMNRSALGSIDLNGNVKQYSIPGLRAAPNLITLGADSNLWFTETAEAGGQFGKFDLSTYETSKYIIPAGVFDVFAMTKGPDNNLWLIFKIKSFEVAKIDTTGTTLKIYPLPEPFDYGITAGNDGNLWIMEGSGDNTSQIGVMTPTTGTIKQYPIQGNVIFTNNQIISAPPGSNNLWFTGLMNGNQGAIFSITTSGTITAYQVPSITEAPVGITFDQNGNLWYITQYPNMIGVL